MPDNKEQKKLEDPPEFERNMLHQNCEGPCKQRLPAHKLGICAQCGLRQCEDCYYGKEHTKACHPPW